MNFGKSILIEDIVKLISCETIGNSCIPITGINEIHKVQVGDITFVDHPKYYDTCLQSNATFILINKKMEVPENKILLLVENPFKAYLKIIAHYKQPIYSFENIHPTAIIAESSIIEKNVVIGAHVIIGENCVIKSNASINEDTIIGNNCIVHSNTVIGSDAFYFKKNKDNKIHYEKMTSCGRVIIHDQVEIGANCTIDKGVSGDTIIGEGTKLDNLIHVGHGVVIGKNCLIAAQVGIAGKTIIEDNVTLWGQVGVNKTLTIGQGAEIFAQSGVPGDLEGNKSYFGSPAKEAREEMREKIWVKRIPELAKKIEDLSTKIDN